MDFVRCAYYLFMYHTGLADSYRNEQYMRKPDFIYNHERKMLALNFNNPDKQQVSLNILKCLKFDYD
jgi:hypothetical protein